MGRNLGETVALGLVSTGNGARVYQVVADTKRRLITAAVLHDITVHGFFMHQRYHQKCC
jgi:hypothetical protein